ncbi:hypothetical protein C8T65DRAFT_579519 [Cerioporus squamosus]|nr:hypothetical protein C8T65DRAFT_579519 [Cerioporus squamosus]
MLGWLPGTGVQKKKWRCLACEPPTWFEYRKAQRHEQTQGHVAAVQRQLRKASMVASTSTAPPPSLGANPHQVVGPLAALLRDVNTTIDDAAPHQADSSYHLDDDIDATHTERHIDWSTISAQLGGTIAPSHTQAALSALTNQLDDWILGGEDSDSDSEPAEHEEPQPEDVRHTA